MHRRAFTVIELAIVLTIIAILAGVVVPQHPAAMPRCDDGAVYTLNSLGEPSTWSSTAFSPLNRYTTALETLERPA